MGHIGQKPAAHHKLLIAELEAVSRGQIDRLMILMPPGSAKSTYASILFPAWWFTQHPRSSIIAASHTADLASYFARQLQRLITEYTDMLGYGIVSNNRATGRWQTTANGEYFATGIRGPVAGHRADLAIIDDPIKSQAAADSSNEREHLWNWYRSDLTTRLKPHGRVILIMTRWHEEDIAGRLLSHNAEWRLVMLPALATADDVLGRAPGEALWPEWEDGTALLRKRDGIGKRAWSALFQQSPRPADAALFRVDRIQIIEQPSADCISHTVRAWDLATTAADRGNDPDWTVGLKLGRSTSGHWIVLDVVRFRGSPYDVENALRRTADSDGRSVIIGLPEDPGQAGRAQIAHYARLLAGYTVRASKESGSKLTRALPVAAQAEAGNLLIARASWSRHLLEELREFPGGRKDDQVDALSRAFAMLTDTPSPTRQFTVPLVGR